MKKIEIILLSAVAFMSVDMRGSGHGGRPPVPPKPSLNGNKYKNPYESQTTNSAQQPKQPNFIVRKAQALKDSYTTWKEQRTTVKQLEKETQQRAIEQSRLDHPKMDHLQDRGRTFSEEPAKKSLGQSLRDTGSDIKNYLKEKLKKTTTRENSEKNSIEMTDVTADTSTATTTNSPSFFRQPISYVKGKFTKKPKEELFGIEEDVSTLKKPTQEQVARRNSLESEVITANEGSNSYIARNALSAPTRESFLSGLFQKKKEKTSNTPTLEESAELDKLESKSQSQQPTSLTPAAGENKPNFFTKLYQGIQNKFPSKRREVRNAGGAGNKALTQEIQNKMNIEPNNGPSFAKRVLNKLNPFKKKKRPTLYPAI